PEETGKLRSLSALRLTTRSLTKSLTSALKRLLNEGLSELHGASRNTSFSRVRASTFIRLAIASSPSPHSSARQRIRRTWNCLLWPGFSFRSAVLATKEKAHKRPHQCSADK